MARTSNIFARVEPEVKEQAEKVLNQLGIPMSNAIGLFLRQVVLQRGIPFDMKLPSNQPLAIGSLSDEQFNAEIEKGFRNLAAGNVVPAERLAEDLRREYGL
ncbi:type II toxin-antitoxin system RelB/DinJ family antitoxin [Ethanoligenens harbinense]|uniref:Addiction module antitoxin, RelB/DinJ family n=1 Tax=Ethanoligenens harbinense (strain DSM 18485 / JCM 12961 / CGMCC 1.5033 / YUAN-3) TaxID=663278 RepID=E6U9N0_ETHHY|nr:type II toxin-antitoxin system RelB/DinJ family antitoxin [Ethanoligenens harbinense]ADU27316.1 addiction module antitoxin, RelB/DinJ family [Ethanoligenens harbinense YUAN-3]AVQ96381.1 type II toxin-antitoxin system antitoxin, RelB/DinJ family [Ethanoligenens harbinense YUAN-3]AYF39039.1 type II toxin-antitoxin system antitoxin, RelB/DinJ family [Ethanoligenens harbinense]AYF41865.1 type II toxin-antitoxin system antitoxin, RelB/DinJ family [Ethanoligenens harbinense]QCN92622.1 type II tox